MTATEIIASQEKLYNSGQMLEGREMSNIIES